MTASITITSPGQLADAYLQVRYEQHQPEVLRQLLGRECKLIHISVKSQHSSETLETTDADRLIEIYQTRLFDIQKQADLRLKSVIPIQNVEAKTISFQATFTKEVLDTGAAKKIEYLENTILRYKTEDKNLKIACIYTKSGLEKALA